MTNEPLQQAVSIYEISIYIWPVNILAYTYRRSLTMFIIIINYLFISLSIIYYDITISIL